MIEIILSKYFKIQQFFNLTFDIIVCFVFTRMEEVDLKILFYEKYGAPYTRAQIQINADPKWTCKIQIVSGFA